MKVVEGSLLDSDAKYICHQTNCVSTGSAGGIARVIFDQFPYSDTYKNRKTRSKPGTLDIMGDGNDNRFVINAYSQYYPGTFNNNIVTDSQERRVKYFHRCLFEISKISDLKSVAFPAGIGCALGGGKWEVYLDLLNRFSKYVHEQQNAVTYIYRLPDSPFECVIS